MLAEKMSESELGDSSYTNRMVTRDVNESSKSLPIIYCHFFSVCELGVCLLFVDCLGCEIILSKMPMNDEKRY